MKYEDFEKAMNDIATEFLYEYGNMIPVLYSGGLDSTAIVLSLVRNGGKPILVHMRGKPSMYERGKQLIMRNLAEKYDLPTVELCGSTKTSYEFLKSFRDMGFKVVISGDGMDRMYMNCYDKNNNSLRFSFGERFRVTHPIMDIILNIIPRLKGVYGKKLPVVTDEYSFKDKLNSDLLGITVLKYSTHPLMAGLFIDYRADIRDIFLRKRYTEKYVGELPLI